MEQEYNHPLYMLNYMLNKATRGGVSKAGAAASVVALHVSLAAARSISLPHPPYSLVPDDAASTHHA